MFFFHYFVVPALLALLVSLATSGALHAPQAKMSRAFLSVLEDLVYRRRRIPGEGGALLGAEDDAMWRPRTRRRSSLSGDAPAADAERLSALRACLGPPFAEARWFRFHPGGLMRKLWLLVPVLYLSRDETKPMIPLALAILVPIALVLIERTAMYVERAQDLAAGSEDAELALLPAWEGRLQSMLVPALAKPILHDATLIFAFFVAFRLLVEPDDSTALLQGAIAIGTCALLLLAHACATLALPRIVDWPPQVVAAGILAYGGGLCALFGAGDSGATASMAGVVLALAACVWAASRHFGRQRAFFCR
jgi:hypothetical protein